MANSELPACKICKTGVDIKRNNRGRYEYVCSKCGYHWEVGETLQKELLGKGK